MIEMFFFFEECKLLFCLLLYPTFKPFLPQVVFWFQHPTQARRLQGEADCPEGADAVVTEANFTNGPRGMHRVPWVVLQVIADLGGFEGGQYKGS